MPIKFQVGKVKGGSERAISLDIASQWNALRQDETLRGYARSIGIDLNLVDRLDENPFLAESEGDNVGVAEAVLIGVAVNVGTAVSMKALTLIWDKILVPALDKDGRTIGEGKDAAR